MEVFVTLNPTTNMMVGRYHKPWVLASYIRIQRSRVALASRRRDHLLQRCQVAVLPARLIKTEQFSKI